jgi:hypothetical protein
VDKRLGAVISVDSFWHSSLRGELYRYHRARAGNSCEMSLDVCADKWLDEGMGYFMSSMRGRTIVVGRKYPVDRFDKDVFQMFKTDFTL